MLAAQYDDLGSRPVLKIRVHDGDLTTACVSKADGARGLVTKVSTEDDRSEVFVSRGQLRKDIGGDAGI